MKKTKLLTLYSLHGFKDINKDLRKEFNFKKDQFHKLSFQKQILEISKSKENSFRQKLKKFEGLRIL